tara:strand:+ start:4787 stop:4948 length:162 start_codon:yes stop_codon:yes gene_type:complete
MNLPNILLEHLPALANAPGLVGSVFQADTPAIDDRIVYLMVYLYEVLPPDAML